MHDPLQRNRRLLGVVLCLGILGVSAELALIEHDESWEQLLPLIASGVSLAALGWNAVSRRRAARLAVRLAMLGLIACAGYGLYLHYASNEEFQRELDPALAGWKLVLATLRSSSPPALAPGALALLGAIGWITTLGSTTTPSPRTNAKP